MIDLLNLQKLQVVQEDVVALALSLTSCQASSCNGGNCNIVEVQPEPVQM